MGMNLAQRTAQTREAAQQPTRAIKQGINAWMTAAGIEEGGLPTEERAQKVWANFGLVGGKDAHIYAV
jgi:hypothetical protein